MEGMAFSSFFPCLNLISMFHCHKKEKEKELFCNTQGDYPRRSAAVAGDRKFDVYMGIDVFGRNTYGGGQWNV